MNIKQLKKHWNRLGEMDPLWAILANPEKKGNRWQIDEFFRTGEEEIAFILDYVRSLRIDVHRARALDFGCGAGRLTQALAHHFEEVCGVDIASSMLQLAERYNRHPNKCKYYLNTRADLTLFAEASFDFVYTTITLQHMEPPYAKAYLKEFLRLLVPGGVLVSQMPSEQIPRSDSPSTSAKTQQSNHSLAKTKKLVESAVPRAWRDRYHKLRYPEPFPRWEMHGIRREELERFLASNGAQVLDVVQSQSAGPGWISFRYCVRKP